MKSLDITSFTGRVGEDFRITLDGATRMEVRLITVTPAPDGWATPAPIAGRRPFSVVFRAPPGMPLPQRIYRLEHDELGTLDMFLVPIGPDADGMCYEAVFS